MYVVGQYKDKIVNSAHVQCFFVGDEQDEDKKIPIFAYLNSATKVLLGAYSNPVQVVTVMATLLEALRFTDDKSVYEFPLDAHPQDTSQEGKMEKDHGTVHTEI